jgi:WD40 repeat protein/tRNA A-37 threonylcarbamoyl transferase component Bud32
VSVQTLSGQTFGQYKLLELLGTGGMSAVYHGYQPELARHVAIKVLSPTLAQEPNYLERFLLEARTIASLEHPHIVPIYDYGTLNGTSYIVERLLTGGTLAERLDARLMNGGSLPSLGETAGLLRQLASALDYSHRRGVIHRDVKSGNVMFDGQGNAFLVDFGIAKLLSSTTSLTGEKHILGTSAYMSPEQWRSEPLTPAVDQYALGILSYLLVTGQLPFDAPTSHEQMYQHLNEMPTPAHMLRPGAPEAVSQVIERAIAKRVEDRYLTVTAFAEDFTAAVRGFEGEPTNFFTFSLSPETMPMAAIDVPDLTPVGNAVIEPQTPVAAPAIPAYSPSQAPTPVSQVISRPSDGPSPKKKQVAGPVLIGVGLGLLALLLLGALVVFLISSLTNPAPTNSGSIADLPTVPGASVLTPLPQPTVVTNVAETQIPTHPPVVPAASQITLSNARNVRQVGLIENDSSPVRSVAISPDNALVAYGTGDHNVRLWDVRSQSIRAILQRHSDVVYAVTFSPDNRLLASGGGDGLINLWNIQTVQLATSLGSNDGQVRSLAFSKGGNALASASADGVISLFDMGNGYNSYRLNQQAGRILCLDFSPDGMLLASGGAEGDVMLWDMASRKPLRTLRGHVGEIRDVKFSPDGKRLASASADNTIRVWDVSTGSLVFSFSGHEHDVFSLAYSPDGNVLASGGRDNNIRLWDVTTGQPITILQGHVGWVFSVAFASDGSLIVSGGGDGTVRLWGLP